MNANFKPKHYYRYSNDLFISDEGFLCLTVLEHKGKRIAVFAYPHEREFFALPIFVDGNGDEYCHVDDSYIEANLELIKDEKA